MIPQRRIERRPKARSLFDRAIIGRAIVDSFKKLDPRWQARNPVMFVVEVGSLVTTIFFIRDLATHQGHAGFDFAISAWLWFTVLFANFAEAVAEGRGKAQADYLRRTKSDTLAKKQDEHGNITEVPSTLLRKGDIVQVDAGDLDTCRRRRHQGRRERGRIRNHGRIRTGHPRVRRRPQCGNRRNPRAFRPDHHSGDNESRREFPGSHDLTCRGCPTPKNAERNRALDPARRANHHLPHRGCDACSVLVVCRHEARPGRPHSATRLSHSHDDRRIALSDRYRRYGSRHAT